MNKNDKSSIINSLVYFLKKDSRLDLINLLNNSDVDFVESDNYFGFGYNTLIYKILLILSIDDYLNIKENIDNYEKEMLDYLNQVIRNNEYISFDRVHIKFINKDDSEYFFQNGHTKSDLLRDIDFLRDTLTLVATGKQKIQDVNKDYIEIYAKVATTLKLVNIQNPNPFNDLWNWYTYWKNNNMPSYESRRVFVNDLYCDLIDRIKNYNISVCDNLVVNIDDWDRLKRTVTEIYHRFDESKSEEQFQAIGQLCRDALISLAQMVYIHESGETSSTNISKADAKGMLNYYISKELSGGKLENLRKLVNATNSFANCVTHDRNTTKKDTHLCITSTISLINIIGILEGKF